MKKKIARIQRWLDRFSAACESRRWDSAIIEADCLSAEVREIRDDLSDLIENADYGKQRLFNREALSMSLRSVAIALLIVCMSTLPLAVESEKPLIAAAQKGENNYEHLSWVTKEEEELIQILRADLSGQNIYTAGTVNNTTDTSKNVASAKKNLRDSGILASKKDVPVKKTANNSDTGLAAEDLLALLQVGEKALHGGDPAIKVIK